MRSKAKRHRLCWHFDLVVLGTGKLTLIVINTSFLENFLTVNKFEKVSSSPQKRYIGVANGKCNTLQGGDTIIFTTILQNAK